MGGQGAKGDHDRDRNESFEMSGAVREERQPAMDEAVEVGPGIIRIQLPISMPGLGHVNCYALPDPDGITLVDPGLPGPAAWKQLRKRLARADLPVKRVHTVVVTHSHPDHFGQAGRLQSEYGARVITHRNFRTFFDPEEEIEEISTDDIGADGPANAAIAPHQQPGDKAGNNRQPWEGPTPWGTSSGPALRSTPDGPPLLRRLQYRLMRRAGGLLGAVPRPTHRVEDADRIELGGRSWVSMHTPGHTNDHLCLFDPEAGVLISGDHVLPTITPHISGTGPIVDALGEFFRSLEAVGELSGVTQVLPAHGLEFSDLAGRAKAIIEHHHERLQLLRDASAEFGWATVPQYSTRLFKPRSQGRMADSETYAHLEHLRLTGEAQVRDDGPELLYLID